MRRDLNILKILPTDSQITICEKLNNNFSQISNLNFGPQGNRGITGSTGPYGFAGERGQTGFPGKRGTRFFVGSTEPLGGFGDVIIEGDYWVNTSTENYDIYVFDNGWSPTGYDMSANSEFEVLQDIADSSGSTSGSWRAIKYKINPTVSTFSFSDSFLNQYNANPGHSMFDVSIDPDLSGGFPLIEFAKTSLNDGSSINYLKNPFFGFKDVSKDNSDLSYISPYGKLDFLTNSPSGSPIRNDLLLKTDSLIRIISGKTVNLGSESGATGGNIMTVSGNLDFKTEGRLKLDFSNALCPNITTSPNSYGNVFLKSHFNNTVSDPSRSALSVKSQIGILSFYYSPSSQAFLKSSTNFSSIIGATGGTPQNSIDNGGSYMRVDLSGETVFDVAQPGYFFSKKKYNKTNFLNPPPVISYSEKTLLKRQIDWISFGSIGAIWSNSGAEFVINDGSYNEIIIKPVTSIARRIGICLFMGHTADELVKGDQGGFLSPEMAGSSFQRLFGKTGESYKLKIKVIGGQGIKYLGITDMTEITPDVGLPMTAYPGKLVPDLSDSDKSVTLPGDGEYFLEFTFLKKTSTPQLGEQNWQDYPYLQTGNLVHYKAGKYSGFFTVG